MYEHDDNKFVRPPAHSYSSSMVNKNNTLWRHACLAHSASVSGNLLQRGLNLYIRFFLNFKQLCHFVLWFQYASKTANQLLWRKFRHRLRFKLLYWWLPLQAVTAISSKWHLRFSCIRYHDDVIKWKNFSVTGHLCGEFTGPRWIPHTKASDAELWFFYPHPNKRLSKQ